MLKFQYLKHIKKLKVSSYLKQFNQKNHYKFAFASFNSKKTNSSYYDILEIQRNATIKEIKEAYFKLAKEYHPDHNPDNKNFEEKFKEIAKAYETLKDPSKRQMYDLGLKNPNFQEESAEQDEFSKKYYTEDELNCDCSHDLADD